QALYLLVRRPPRHPHSFPTRRSSDLPTVNRTASPGTARERSCCCRHTTRFGSAGKARGWAPPILVCSRKPGSPASSRLPTCAARSEEHTSELQSRGHLVCRLLLEKKQ